MYVLISPVIHVSGSQKSQRRVTLLVMYCQFNNYRTLLWCNLYENPDFDLNNLTIWFIIDNQSNTLNVLNQLDCYNRQTLLLLFLLFLFRCCPCFCYYNFIVTPAPDIFIDWYYYCYFVVAPAFGTRWLYQEVQFFSRTWFAKKWLGVES